MVTAAINYWGRAYETQPRAVESCKMSSPNMIDVIQRSVVDDARIAASLDNTGVAITWRYRSDLSHKRARRVGHDFRLTHVHRVE